MPTKSAPAACASRAFSPAAITSTRTDFPVPAGQHDRAAHELVGVARIDAETHRHLDGLVELGEGRLLDDLERLARLIRAFPNSRRFGRVRGTSCRGARISP